MMNYLVLTILVLSALMASCQWQDANGDQWIALPAQRYSDAYAQGAYDVCLLHNLRVLAARGVDITSPAVGEYVDATCHKLANEMDAMRDEARDQPMSGPEPTPFVCEAGCV